MPDVILVGAAVCSAMSRSFCSPYVTYAHPGGANVQPIDTVVIPPVVR